MPVKFAATHSIIPRGLPQTGRGPTSTPIGNADGPAGLPPAKGGFVGRKQELDQVGALLMGPARLVTLIGPGGIGKTRLAEEAVRRLDRARHTPVFAVRLAGVPKDADAAAVRAAVAAAVLAGPVVGASTWDGVVGTLSQVDAAGRVVDTVLVLDNCEHVLAGVGGVIVDLLDAVPGLTVLVTSRSSVGWVDEQLVTVPSLSVTLSVELFRQRAELAGYSITEPDQVALAEQICGHMHGNPLCIGLAAARMFYEPLSMILRQLSGESDDMRMRWRHGPRVGSDSRHRGISDVIAWSYELCADKERLLLDRLSVFAPRHAVNLGESGTGGIDAGAELEAIEVVCADDVPMRAQSTAVADLPGVDLAREEIHELLERLIEQSLVSVHMTADSVRYYLLESVRLFAADRLAERSTEEIDEPARLAQRHCYYYRDKVLYAQAEWFGPAEQQLLAWVSGAWPNIRRAIDASMQTAGDAVMGLQIAVALRAPFQIGSLSEIRGRIEQTLTATQASPSQPSELQLAAMAQIAWFALVQGRSRDAEELLDRCVAACDGHATHAGHWRDRPETDIGLPAAVDYVWGVELMLAHRDPRAIAVFARAREKFRVSADRGGEAVCGLFEALSAGFFGSADQAMTIAQRYLERTTAAGARLAQSWAQIAFALALTKHGDAKTALQLGCAARAYQLPVGHRWGAIWALHICMWSLARLIADEIAAEKTSRSTLVKLATEMAYLSGGVKAQARTGVLIEQLVPHSDETRTAEKIARDVLGQQIYTDAEQRGSALFLERSDLERMELGTLSITAPSRAAAETSSWDCLSGAEQEVALLAAAGWPNSAIGVRRGTTTRTTDVQMSSILQKLMIDSRQGIVRFVPQDRLNQVSNERSHIPRQSRHKPRSIHPRH